VNDSSNQNALRDLVRRSSRSFLQYVSEAFPWTTPQELEALDQLQKLAAEERAATNALTEFLARRERVFPYVGPYPAEFTNSNYVSLEHLLPLLVEAQQQALRELDRDAPAVRAPEAQNLVRKLRESQERHLQSLKTLATTYPETASTLR
jgi:rubrerythrin